MTNNLNEMTPVELRELISQAKRRLAEVQPPSKRWLMLAFRTRTAMDHRDIVVEAEDAHTALAAANAHQDLLNESNDWDQDDEDVTEFVINDDPEECDLEPDYRVGANGELEEVE